MFIVPNGMYYTEYIDERGRGLLSTFDVSDAIVTVWDEQLNEFWERWEKIFYSDDDDFLWHNKDWNFEMKSWLVGH